MNASSRRTELLAFWYWTEWASAPSMPTSNPAAARARAFRSSRALHQMKSTTSGWSPSSTTILAARRVFPPLLMVPAEASAPRMKLTGPLAVPPPVSGSRDDRMRLRFTPEPDPPLKIVPSSTYHSRIEGMVSSTDRMKQALACWGTPCTPMLNHTGELNAAFWVTRRWVSSSRKIWASSEVAKYPSRVPHSTIVPTTRSITWVSDRSRSSVPRAPRKYFWARMFTAMVDHEAGTSTSSCSNATLPSMALTIRASRRSQSISSYGSIPAVVYCRRSPSVI